MRKGRMKIKEGNRNKEEQGGKKVDDNVERRNKNKGNGKREEG